MRKIKHRHSKARQALTPKRFHFVTIPDGRAVVFRGQNQFNWGPIDVDRDALRRLIGKLNGLHGTAIERIGRKLCEEFKAEYDAGEHRRTVIQDPNADSGVVDDAGPAEPGNEDAIATAKGIECHLTK